MKKFLSVILLMFGIIFGSQLVAVEKVSAADVYAYSEGGVEYYVTGSRTLNPFVGAFGASVKGVSGGKVVKYLYFVCNPAPSNGKWVYQIQDQTGGMRSSYVVEEGYLSNSGKAQTVYNIVKSGKLNETNSTNDGKVNFNGHSYKIFNENSNWEKAKKRCEEMGGHLVTINSQAEQNFIEHLINAQGKRNNIWIGGYRDNSNVWRWITGENFSYTHWASGRPDNYKNIQDKAMIMNKIHTGYFGTWDDIESSGGNPPRYGEENFSFICEWE